MHIMRKSVLLKRPDCSNGRSDHDKNSEYNVWNKIELKTAKITKQWDDRSQKNNIQTTNGMYTKKRKESYI